MCRRLFFVIAILKDLPCYLTFVLSSTNYISLPVSPRRSLRSHGIHHAKKLRTSVEEEESSSSSNSVLPSIGESIEFATKLSSASSIITSLLETSSRLWLPTDENLPSHYQTQQIHHERRRKWASRILWELGKNYHHHHDDILWHDERLVRAVLAAAMPIVIPTKPQNQSQIQHLQTELNSAPTPTHLNSISPKLHIALAQAIIGLHTLAGKYPQTAFSSTQSKLLIHGIQLLVQQANHNAKFFDFRLALEIRWAIRGLFTRFFGISWLPTNQSNKQQQCSTIIPNLDDRVTHLPFDIIPQALNCSHMLVQFNHSQTSTNITKQNPYQLQNEKEHQKDAILQILLRDIPFSYDHIITRRGSFATERRATAWVTRPGIGALAYSGKLMAPVQPLPFSVDYIMTAMEQTLELTAITTTASLSADDDADFFFDGALCNFYANDGESACAFHADPEHGTVWDRRTVVVCIGSDREFAFRPIKTQTCWSNWDTVHQEDDDGSNDDEQHRAAVHRVFSGDAIYMKDSCNDMFHHAVYADGNSGTKTERERERAGRGPRISLVLKRSIDRGNGQRGHGLMGQGRKSKRAKKMVRHKHN